MDKLVVAKLVKYTSIQKVAYFKQLCFFFTMV